MTKTVVIITVSFIVLTLPSAIVSAYYNQISSLVYGRLLIEVFNEISFSFHGLSFITLLYSNKQFFNQVKSFFIYRGVENKGFTVAT
jgi:hypothetical protein